VPNEWTFIAAAYALTWLTLGGYALWLWRRARRAERVLNQIDPTRSA
jgi:CcmD family protein